jgi:CxxC-x17-CxxC domain-containing protein
MRDYNRNDRGGDRGGRRFGEKDSGRRSFGGRNSSRREMHHATCAQCGKDCEVPFCPNSDRPVYCSDCFEKRRNEDGGFRGSGDRNFGRPNFDERRSDSPDRSDRGNTGGRDSGQLIDQLKSLNIKLDKIITILEPTTINSQVPKKEVAEIPLKPKVVEIKSPKKKVAPKKVKTEKSLES